MLVSISNLCSTTRLDIYTQVGGAAAFTVGLLIYPLDTFKMRYQSPDYAEATLS